MSTTRAITLRLELADYERLEKEAERLGMPPATLARVYVRAGLSSGTDTEASKKGQAFLEALERMTELRESLRRAGFPPIDAVQIVREGREELEQRFSQ